MKKIKLFVTGLFVLMTIVSAPLVGLADNNKSDDAKIAKMEQKMENSQNKNANSFWNRMFRLFAGRASAGIANNGLTPSIVGISAPTVLKIGEVGTWTVKAKDPQNGNLSYAVNWGDELSQPQIKSGQLSFVQDATFTHAYDKAGKYLITFTVSNDAGYQATSTVTVHIIGVGTNTLAPVIKSLDGPRKISVGQTETIVVNAYDPQNGNLTYAADWGDNSIVSNSVNKIAQPIFVGSASFSHIYNLAGVYRATFTVKNDAGLEDTKSIRITVTSASSSDVTAPVVSGVDSSTGTSFATIKWITDEVATSKVYYSLNTPLDINANTTASVTDKNLVIGHTLTLSGLAGNTTFYYKVESTDASGNKTLSGEFKFTTL